VSDIRAQIQKLDPGTVIDLFMFIVTEGSLVYYFHAGKNELAGDIVFNGVTFAAWPLEATGFARASDEIARPRLVVANVLGTISELCRQYGDLVGRQVQRIRTFAKYLDAANFPGGVNASADPTAELPREVYRVNRKSGEGSAVVTFELAPYWDITGVKLPRRVCLKNVCGWQYRSAECTYAGGYVDSSGNATAYQYLDICGKRISDCKARFGNAALPFGGFPGLRRVPR
jgi:lambda family phage minor tail protein L